MAVPAVCEKCGGSGWVIHEKEGLSAAERCSCQVVERAEHNLEAAQIPPLYQNASFENFLLPKDNPLAHQGLTTALMTARAYVRDFPATDKPGLLFIGNPGVGKTHLAAASLHRLIARGFEGVFFDYQNLLDRIRASYSEISGTSDREAYRTVLDADILLLDDLGNHRISDWVEDTVTSILTWRCNHRKPTIVTTNFADADAGNTVAERNKATSQPEHRITLGERVGMRARSRLFEMCRVIRMPVVEDYRIRGAKR